MSRRRRYSLAWVGSPFAEHMGPRTIRVIRDLAGVPGEYVWAAKQTTRDRAAPPPRPFAYTISNLGLRRLLATARSQGEALDVYYERLAGAVGDETWRTATPGTAYRVRLAADGSVSCGTGALYLSSSRAARRMVAAATRTTLRGGGAPTTRIPPRRLRRPRARAAGAAVAAVARARVHAAAAAEPYRPRHDGRDALRHLGLILDILPSLSILC